MVADAASGLAGIVDAAASGEISKDIGVRNVDFVGEGWRQAGEFVAGEGYGTVAGDIGRLAAPLAFGGLSPRGAGNRFVNYRETAAPSRIAPVVEQSSGFDASPFTPRTVNLPQSASIVEILENGWIPGREGITISDSSIRFADMYRMTEMHGIEFGLVRETLDDAGVYRLYSGGRNSVAMPSNSTARIIGHTHPSGSPFPSSSDINNINRAFLNGIEANPLAPVPHRRVIWGSGLEDSTLYYPNVLR